MNISDIVSYRALRDNAILAVESYTSRYINKCKNGTVGIYDKVRYILLRRYASYFLNRAIVYSIHSLDTLYKEGEIVKGTLEDVGIEIFSDYDAERLLANHPDGWSSTGASLDGDGLLFINGGFLLLYLDGAYNAVNNSLNINRDYRLKFKVKTSAKNVISIKLTDTDFIYYSKTLGYIEDYEDIEIYFRTSNPSVLYLQLILTNGYTANFIFDSLVEVTSEYFECFKDMNISGISLYNIDYWRKFPSFTYNEDNIKTALTNINRICGSNLTI